MAARDPWDLDWTQVIYGEHARSVPAWWWVQNQGSDRQRRPVVAIVGASTWNEVAPHPARYDSARSHLLMVGELILRPRLIVATDARRGDGWHSLGMDPFTVGELDGREGGGEVLLGEWPPA
jgi:hypothetical protein